MTSLYSSDGHGSLAILDRIVEVDKFIQLEALLPPEVALDATMVKITTRSMYDGTHRSGGVDGAATAIPLRSVMTGHLLDIRALYY